MNHDVVRCQGRLVRAMGSATLARDCPDCARRTNIPTDGQIIWIEPPQMANWHPICIAYRPPLRMEMGDCE